MCSLQQEHIAAILSDPIIIFADEDDDGALVGHLEDDLALSGEEIDADYDDDEHGRFTLR